MRGFGGLAWWAAVWWFAIGTLANRSALALLVLPDPLWPVLRPCAWLLARVSIKATHLSLECARETGMMGGV